MNDAIQASEKVFATLISAIEALGYTYEKKSERQIAFTATGNDIPMNFCVEVNCDKQIVVLYSFLPLEADKSVAGEMALAVCSINYRLADGSFDYSIPTGKIAFRMTANYRDSEIGKELLDYMIRCSIMTVDRYNDKLLMLSRGLMTLDEFSEEIGFQ